MLMLEIVTPLFSGMRSRLTHAAGCDSTTVPERSPSNVRFARFGVNMEHMTHDTPRPQASGRSTCRSHDVGSPRESRPSRRPTLWRSFVQRCKEIQQKL